MYYRAKRLAAPFVIEKPEAWWEAVDAGMRPNEDIAIVLEVRAPRRTIVIGAALDRTSLSQLHPITSSDAIIRALSAVLQDSRGALQLSMQGLVGRFAAADDGEYR